MASPQVKSRLEAASAEAAARARGGLGFARKPVGWVLHAPQVLRALVRADELWLVVLAAGIGVAAGVFVAGMNSITQSMREQFYHLFEGARLSAQVSIDPLRALLVPSIGGLALGLAGIGIARVWPRRTIDPIEANALYGGQMSMVDSLVVVIQTLLSNGVGASVGLEAGYTQIGSAFASRIGRSFRVRRSDLRLLVGCGAAAAIAAAFNAPLTGAFYAFELVIGTYSIASLAPVVMSAIMADWVIRLITGVDGFLPLQLPSRIEAVDYLPILALGVLCALIGIALMRGVTLTETAFRKSSVPGWLRPAIGGLVLGLLALISPIVLSSGHGALKAGLDAPFPLQHVAVLLGLKAVGSAVSIGSGFRGGLFFASLLLGALVGKLFAGVLLLITVTQTFPTVVCALVGMAAFAVAVVGGPLTMTFLILESTGSLSVTIASLAACVVSALTVRRTFGYSFATWRFHLRGEAIRSAVDIGWMRNLTVGRMMRREIRTVRDDTALPAFRRDFPLGSASRVTLVDATGRYRGIVQLPEAHSSESTAETLGDLAHYERAVLLPQMTVKEAVAMFENAEADALAVVDGADSMKVIGMLTEAHALRRYSEELDRRRRELSGE